MHLLTIFHLDQIMKLGVVLWCYWYISCLQIWTGFGLFILLSLMSWYPLLYYKDLCCLAAGDGGAILGGGGGQMPLIVHFYYKHFLGTGQLIPLSSFEFDWFSFQGLDMPRSCWCVQLFLFLLFTRSGIHVIKDIWMDFKKKESYGLFWELRFHNDKGTGR